MNDEAARKQAEESSVLADLGRIVNSSLEIDEVYRRIGREVAKLIKFDRLCITVIDEGNESVSNTFITGIDIPKLRVGQSFPLSETSSGVSKTSQLIQPQGKEELAELVPAIVALYQAGLRSFMVVPLISQGKIVAVLRLQSMEVSAYSDVDVRLAESVASQIAGAVANSQQFSKMEQMEQESRVLAALGRIINSSLAIDQYFERFGEEINKVIPFDRMSLSIVNHEKGNMWPTWVLGTDVPGLQEADEFPMEKSLAGEVVRTGAPYMLDAETEPDLEDRFPGLIPVYKAGVVSFLAIPLLSRDVVIGVLRIGSKHRWAYTQKHLDLLERMGNQIAGAIANSQIFSERERMEQEASALAELGRIVNSSLDIEDVYGRLGEVIRKVVPYDRLVLTLTEEENDTMSCAVAIGVDIPHHGHGEEYHLAGSYYEEVIQGRSPNLLEVETASELTGNAVQLIPAYEVGLRSFVVTPLIDREIAYGVLWVQSKNRGIYTQRHLELIERIGNQIAGAIANSRLYTELQRAEEEERRRRTELEVRYTLARIFSRHGSLESKLKEVLQELIRATDSEWATLRMMDEEQKGLRLISSAGFSSKWDRPLLLPLGQGLSLGSTAVGEGRVFVANDYPSHPSAEPTAVSQGAKSTMSAPIVIGSRAIGSVTVVSTAPNHYTDDRVELLPAIIEGLGVLLERANLVDEREVAEEAERERSGELAAVYEIASIVASPDAFGEKAERVLNVLTDVSGADWAGLMVPKEDEPGLHLIAAVGMGVETSPPTSVFTEEQDFFMSAFLNGQIEVINDYAAEPNPSASALALGVRSMVIIPMKAEGHIRGLVNVISITPHYFTPEIVQLLTAVGDGLGIHLEKARLDEEQQRMLLENQALTESIQKSYTELSGEIADRERTEKILAERTEDLASVGKMASEIAHEVNNPLAAVMGLAELLKSQNLPGEAGEDVDRIYNQAQRAAEVVKSLLTYARRPEIEKSFADVTGAVSRALTLITQDLSNGNIEVLQQYEKGLPKTMADEHQLTQVFLNIVTNAVQSLTANAGNRTLWINGWQEESNLRFSFRDNGQGISPENLGQVFDPFFTTKEVGKGTGLGLSMCSRIVRAHGGKIWAESEEGNGATIHVELPVESRMELPAVLPVGETGTNNGSNILMVDDEETFTRVWHRVLSKDGHIVTIAAGGEEALQAISNNRYECILMDMRMPGMGGKELYQRIKGSDEGLAKRVIFATGDALNPETKDYLESTGNAWLAKPFTIEELKAKIQECISQ